MPTPISHFITLPVAALKESRTNSKSTLGAIQQVYHLYLPAIGCATPQTQTSSNSRRPILALVPISGGLFLHRLLSPSILNFAQHSRELSPPAPSPFRLPCSVHTKSQSISLSKRFHLYHESTERQCTFENNKKKNESIAHNKNSNVRFRNPGEGGWGGVAELE